LRPAFARPRSIRRIRQTKLPCEPVPELLPEDAALDGLDLSGLEVEEITSERRYAGLPKGHRLARAPCISIMDLKDEPIMWTRRAPRYWVDWWAVNPRPDGAEPRWGPENDNVEEMLEQVADGAGYCICPRSMTEFYGRPDLVWVPLADAEPLRIALAWRGGERSPLVPAFAEVVRELASAP